MISKQPGAIVIEGHVQGLSITRSLGEKCIPVIVVDSKNCITRYSKYCISYFRCPDYQKSEFIDFLIRLCKKESLYNWSLFPTNDFAVYNISKNKDKLQKYFKIITPGLEIIENIFNKKKTLEIAKSLGIGNPKTYYPSSLSLNDYSLNFPVVVKGIEGLSFYKKTGKKAVISRSNVSLKQNLKLISEKITLDKLMIQEVIPNCENNKVISFTSFAENGNIKTFWMGKKVREHPLLFGTATFCESIYESELLIYGQKILKELNYTGVSEIEFIRNPLTNEFALIEINARTWLWVSLAKRCGVDFPMIIYNFLHNFCQEYPSSYFLNVKWQHIWTDVAFFLKGFIEGKYKFSTYLKSLEGKKEFAVLCKKDLAPFFFEVLLLFYLMRKR